MEYEEMNNRIIEFNRNYPLYLGIIFYYSLSEGIDIHWRAHR